ncbi:MAG TPA: glycosyltransferase family 4 protein [Solirubrobacteraceae bacterium]|jgi:glycosyltransferase involved in cell wall biosynthesis|nr:glycosyltransferase family 4 protein [Solirubrobacteraceae bacterium]
MRVLFVNHTAVVGGGERSLLELLSALALQDDVELLLATPSGALQALAEQRGIATTPIRGTAGSLRLHPLHTPRALLEMALAAWQVRRAAARHRAEVVHANSIRAGIVLAIARIRGRARIVHVRDCLPPGRLSSATLRLIAASATTVIANSRYTAEAVRSVAPRARLRVVYNAVELTRFDPSRIDRAAARAQLGVDGERPVLLGVVAQITPWKGQDTAIEALRLLREDGVDARLLLVGAAKFVAAATRFDNEDYVARLHQLIERAGLGEHVEWLGERDDVPEVVRALDVLLLPSWEEPFGRAAIEAMALEVPVVATTVGGPAEIVLDGREGYLAEPRRPRAWADAVGAVLQSADRGAAMGHAGREHVEREFTIAQHVASIRAIYRSAYDAAERGDQRL